MITHSRKDLIKPTIISFKDRKDKSKVPSELLHTTYSRNILCQKFGGICGLWVLNEKIKKCMYILKNMKKIVGAVWKLPDK
jgi:hypothetical protein